MEERGCSLKKTRNLYSEKKFLQKKYYTFHWGEYLIYTAAEARSIAQFKLIISIQNITFVHY
jgi:hypothetical protein